MEVTFSSQTVVFRGTTTVSMETEENLRSVAVKKEPPAQYFNPKISVDPKSGMILLQYRSQTGDMKMQIPSENVVKYYNTHGCRRFDPPGTVVVSEPDSDTRTPLPATTAPPASSS